MSEHSVQFSPASPETILAPIAPELAALLDAARSEPPEGRRQSIADVVRRDPRCLQAWADLAEQASDPVERYAYARVGYHRGLDALRAAGWRGSGLVRWEHEPNRGFLRSVHLLETAAGDLGETDEQQRCALFLRQLDPTWGRGAA